LAKTRLRLLLLDANVVIELHRLKIWGGIVDHCEIVLARTVVTESRHAEIDGRQVQIDLRPDIESVRITVVDVELARIRAFRGRFTETFLERLDPGELESLAYLVEVDKECLMSSADKIVWRTLGALRQGERGISLEEILNRVGLGRALEEHFGQGYRERWTRHGFGEGLQGQATGES
jgi:hypothetical protein